MFSNMARRIALTESFLLGGMVNNITIDNRQLWCLGILIWTRSGAWKLGPITMINENLQCFSMFLTTRDHALSRMLPKSYERSDTRRDTRSKGRNRKCLYGRYHLSAIIRRKRVASCVTRSQYETATLLGIIVHARRPRLGDCQSCECSISASFPTASNRVLGVCSALADD